VEFNLIFWHKCGGLLVISGLFGVKIFQKRELVNALTRVMTTIGDKQEYYVDQYLLARVFWPVAKDDAVRLYPYLILSSD
jgi:hypothetical protein